jgi:hypothetical protein
VNGGESLPTVQVHNPDWLQGKAVFLYQNGLKRASQLPQCQQWPSWSPSTRAPSEGRQVEVAKSGQVMGALAGTAEIGRSILTTPGVPAERLGALRIAFQRMLADPDFLAAMAKRNVDDRARDWRSDGLR